MKRSYGCDLSIRTLFEAISALMDYWDGTPKTINLNPSLHRVDKYVTNKAF